MYTVHVAIIMIMRLSIACTLNKLYPIVFGFNSNVLDNIDSTISVVVIILIDTMHTIMNMMKLINYFAILLS